MFKKMLHLIRYRTEPNHEMRVWSGLFESLDCNIGGIWLLDIRLDLTVIIITLNHHQVRVKNI